MNIERVNVGLGIVARKFFDMDYVEQVSPSLRKAVESDRAIIHSLGSPLLDPDDAARAASLFKERECDLVILVSATFADASMAATIAGEIEAPIILWALPEPESPEGGRLRLNSFCGANLAGNALANMDRQYSFVYGAPDDPEALRDLDRHIRVASTVKSLRKTRLGLFGQHPTGYYACDFDEMQLKRTVGTQVDEVSLVELQARASKVPDDQQQHFLEELRQITKGLDQVDPEQAARTARSYGALRGLVAERKYDAVAVRCWPEFFADYGHAVCAAMSRLTDGGTMAGCESDVNGAVTMMAQHCLTGEAAFIADIVALDKEQNAWALWHCGAGPTSLANPKREIISKTQPNRKIAIGFWFGMKPGPVTIARLSFLRGEYRMLIARGEALDQPPRYQASNALVRLENDAIGAAKKLVELGFEHHVSMCYGDVSEELAMIADRWGIETVRL